MLMVKLEDILELSVAERILMIERIWDSIDHDQIDLSNSQKEELDRRLARYERGETAFVSWEDVKSELRSYKK
ncbi:MAG: addiction module protein [Bacteroidetes bacterium]|nr:addiction module protein [Bacteroidota bacterium]